MTEVVYADVLVVLNVYVTYLLLSMTGIICKKKRNALRLLLSSAVSGFYSLIILIPDISEAVTAITRIPAGIIFVLIAFGFVSKKAFIRLTLCFFAVSFGFAGIMLFLWLFFSPQGMYYNNGIVYFNIDTVTLVILTIACYVILSVFNHFIKSRVPSDTVYDCEITVRGKIYYCHCFYDTGHSLSDVYTSNPVVIISKEKFKNILPENSFNLSDDNGLSLRLIPCSGIGGRALLLSFNCEKIRVRGISTDFTRADVTIAVTDEKIRGGSFDGILPTELFDNSEKGADFENENQSSAVKT